MKTEATDTPPAANAVGAHVDQGVRPDAERLAFEDWADEQWGREAYRHKSATSGEWDTWRAARRDMPVLKCQVDSLRAALLRVLDAREKEAKAYFAYQTARDNYSGGAALEGRRHMAAMTAASDAERQARVLLLTLKA